jgi:hypothetical protein
MTFDDIMTFVRAQADADVTDAPDSLLTVHCRVAYNDILSRKNAWDHLEVSYTQTMTAGVDTYPFTGFTGGADMDRIYSVRYLNGGLSHRLTYMTREDAEIMFGLVAQTGLPTAYTVWNGQLQVFPAPSDAYVLTIRGFRDPAAWPTSVGSVPDLPVEFHDAIAWYVLSGYYTSQEDLQMAGLYMNEYQQQIDRMLAGVASKNQMPRPMIMGGQSAVPRPFLDRVKGMLE